MIRKQCWILLTLSLIASAAVAQQPFTIRGRVVDAASKPVTGATVRLLSPGSNGFDVDEKTTTDAEGRFSIAAPPKWTHMDQTHRQELALVAKQGDRLALVQFSRTSAAPKSDVELTLSNVGGARIEILSPELQPVVRAKVKITALNGDLVTVDLSEAQLAQYGAKARKTSFGYVVGAHTAGLPEDLVIEAGLTDAKGFATAANVTAARIGGITVHSDEFGDQTIAHFTFQRASAPGWPTRIVLKKTGRLEGQLTSPVAGAIANHELTVSTADVNQATGIYHATVAKIVTDREGKFNVPKMIAGTVRYQLKFDASKPTRPEQTTETPYLKAGETLSLKIDLKPAVRVEGRVLDAADKKPIRDVEVRAYLGIGFEAAISDAEGKFFFWMPPGEAAFHPNIPEGYLPAIRPSDYFDPVKRQQTVAAFKVPEGKSFEAPPILLYRRTTLRGVVVDDQGRPLAGTGVSGIAMSLDRRTGQPKPSEVTVQANERGEFTIAEIDPREPLRLRLTVKEVTKVMTIAKPGSEAVRIVIAPNERFHMSGRVADAEGKPVADAILELWHRDWAPAPTEAEPKKLALKIRADAQGQFKTPPLSADGHYRFTVRAAGARTTESAWLDSTQPEAAKPQQLVVTRLGGLAGIVRDRAGKAIADAHVSLFAKDTRTETTTNRDGEFKLEAPSGKPFFVVVRHPEFRADGSLYEKHPQNLNQTMIRLTEPGTKLAPQPFLAKEEREKMLHRLMEPLKQKLAKSDSKEQVMTLQTLTGPAPEFVTEFLEKHPLPSAMYTEMLTMQVAMKKVSHSPEEAEELIGRFPQGAQQSMAYGLLVDALPEKARAKKLELLAEALVGARAEKSPEFRTMSMGKVATRLFFLGEKDRASGLLREAEKIANGLSTSAYGGFARGTFATDLALIDLPAALALLKGLTDRGEFARHHGNTAHRIAGLQPAEAVRVLDLLPPRAPNEFNQRDYYAIRVCYRIAKVDLNAALQLVNSITDLPSRAHALGVMAQAVAKADPKQAPRLVRLAFATLEEDAGRPEPPQAISALTGGSVAAALTLIAEQIDPTLIRECLWRAVALQKPHMDKSDNAWRHALANHALAMLAARYDSKLAEFLMPPKPAEWVSREAQLAGFLINPRRAIEAAEKAPTAKDDRERLQLIGYLATEEDRIPRLILNTLGLWRIDVEDHDF